jgi:hypothetical protein
MDVKTVGSTRTLTDRIMRITTSNSRRVKPRRMEGPPKFEIHIKEMPKSNKAGNYPSEQHENLKISHVAPLIDRAGYSTNFSLNNTVRR